MSYERNIKGIAHNCDEEIGHRSEPPQYIISN